MELSPEFLALKALMLSIRALWEHSFGIILNLGHHLRRCLMILLFLALAAILFDGAEAFGKSLGKTFKPWHVISNNVV